MKKTLGQIAREAADRWDRHCLWNIDKYDFVSAAVKRAVLRELRREGRLAPVKSQIISVTKARKK